MTLDYIFEGHAYRLNAMGRVRLDNRGETISGSFRVLDRNNSGQAGVVIGDGGFPEIFYLVPIHSCAVLKRVELCPECEIEPCENGGRCGTCRARSML